MIIVRDSSGLIDLISNNVWILLIVAIVVFLEIIVFFSSQNQGKTKAKIFLIQSLQKDVEIDQFPIENEPQIQTKTIQTNLRRSSRSPSRTNDSKSIKQSSQKPFSIEFDEKPTPTRRSSSKSPSRKSVSQKKQIEIEDIQIGEIVEQPQIDQSSMKIVENVESEKTSKQVNNDQTKNQRKSKNSKTIVNVDSQLWNAILKQNLDSVKKAISEGANVNTNSKSIITPNSKSVFGASQNFFEYHAFSFKSALEVAATLGYSEIVQFLLSQPGIQLPKSEFWNSFPSTPHWNQAIVWKTWISLPNAQWTDVSKLKLILNRRVALEIVYLFPPSEITRNVVLRLKSMSVVRNFVEMELKSLSSVQMNFICKNLGLRNMESDESRQLSRKESIELLKRYFQSK